ncbi:cytochrome P450 [Melanomma pulvis-pyrius CBS 109.77]|uniref:Cytochrome P450 n=1 Tax=Melanomma pulvis-pyrius CBS 109.77 TaxID=1314802 RepID=A0A6A6X0G9_9PLEO|nr:cytochrome P450 [Melanomma pulvis-pyrius CBS 109.77]
MVSGQLLLLLAAIVIGTFLARRIWGSLSHRDKQDKLEREKFWKTVENVGIPPRGGFFAQTRGLLSSLTSVQSWTHSGYGRISKAQKLPFALPTIWTWDNVAVLPPSALRILSKPESEVTAFGAQLETIQLPYMISDRDIYMNVIHFDVARKHLVNPKDVASLAAATADEVDVAFTDVWGTSPEWKTVNAWDACGRIIMRAAIRVLIGLPTCRDETYFEQSRLFSDAVIMGTAMINTMPPLLRPVYHQARCLKILVPFVEDRIRIWKQGGEKGEDGSENDFLQWLIPKCAKEGPEQMAPTKLANRLLTFNVMFVIGMVYVFGHTVLDLYSSPNKDAYLAGLEAECHRVSAQHDGLTSRAAVDQLHRLDSVIRESMRVSDIAVTALARDVVGKPLDLGAGVQVPRGTRVVFPTHAIHRDEEYYEDPLRFDAFRFSRPFEGSSEDVAAEAKDQKDSLTTITPSFLAFGYGKHACPGRFFAAQTMKQALAGIVMDYDVEIISRPEKRQVMLNMMIPAVDAQMRYRRKTKK